MWALLFRIKSTLKGFIFLSFRNNLNINITERDKLYFYLQKIFFLNVRTKLYTHYCHYFRQVN